MQRTVRDLKIAAVTLVGGATIDTANVAAPVEALTARLTADLYYNEKTGISHFCEQPANRNHKQCQKELGEKAQSNMKSREVE